MGGEEGPYLGCVMVEDDCIEVPAVVVFDEVLCGVGCLQAPSPNTFMLQQSLVQGKQHLAGEREKGIRAVLTDWLASGSAFHPWNARAPGVE